MPKRKYQADDCAVECFPVEAERSEEIAAGEAPPLTLEEMEEVLSRYAGLSVDPHRPCTSQEGRLCHIFGSLKAWNSFLWLVGLELQEKAVAELSLVKASDGTHLTQMASRNERELVGLYLYRLLSGHHCVVEATINDEVLNDHQVVMCRAIRESRGLTRITLALSSLRLRNSMRDLAEAIASLSRLKSLSLHGDIEGGFLADLAPMLASTASLKVFRAADIRVTDPSVNDFKGGLFKNTSITELSLTTEVLDDGSGCYGPDNLDIGLFLYLRANTSLTELSITAPREGPEVDVWTVCLALSENTVLTRLNLDVITLRSDYATPIKTLLNSCKALKYFSLRYKVVDCRYAVKSEYRGPEGVGSQMKYCSQCRKTHSEVTEQLRPWIMALLSEAASLKELTLSMWAFCLVECLAFLQAMTGNRSPEKLIVTDLDQNTLHVCTALTESGMQERVLVKSRCSVYYPDIDNPSWSGGTSTLPFGVLQDAADRVTTTGNRVKVTLQVFSILYATGATDPASTAIVQLIEKAHCIHDLVLCLQHACCSECWNRCAAAVCDAVCRNATIGTLSVRFSGQRCVDMAPLARLLHKSCALRSFSLRPPCHDAFIGFVAELSKPDFGKNYALQRLKFHHREAGMMIERLAIQDNVLRNRALPKRAAAYVAGTSAKYTGDAFEKVFKNLTLIEELQFAVSDEESGARQLIAEGAHRLAGFPEFMCLAGVVFESFECNPTDDGRTQLDDLPEECLRLIRQYLRLADVQDSLEQAHRDLAAVQL